MPNKTTLTEQITSYILINKKYNIKWEFVGYNLLKIASISNMAALQFNNIAKYNVIFTV